MYKRTSRVLQHAHRVDTIDPSKGFVWRDDENDLIPNAGNMSLAMCRDECRQMAMEQAKIANALAIAKRLKDKEQVSFLGHQLQALGYRRSSVKERMRALTGEHDGQLYKAAINAVLPEEMRQKVFAHVRQARDALIDGARDE